MREEPASGPPWLVSHAVDVVFGVLLSAAFVHGLWVTRQYFFWFDDWPLVRQSGTMAGLVDHYNGHLSVVILAIYRVLIEVFGFQHTPFRVVGMLCLFAAPVGFFVTTRRFLGPALAAVLGLSFLAGERISFIPLELNHYLALVGGIGCAAALNRGPRADPWLAAALAFSLGSAGGGVAVAAGCVVHNLCVRPSVRRWAAVLGPSALWGFWWLLVGRDESVGIKRTASGAFDIARDIAFAGFESLGLHRSVLGWALVVVFLGYGVWLLWHGLDAAANWLAWTTALAFWGLGLYYSRTALPSPHVFRYQVVVMGFILLAVVPRRPIEWPRQLPLGSDGRWAAASVVVVAVAMVRAPAFRSELRESSQLVAAASEQNRGHVVMVGLDPPVVPDGLGLPLGMGLLRAGQLRSLLDRHGNPFPSEPATADQQLVDLGLVGSRGDGGRFVSCTPLTEPYLYQPTGFSLQYLWSPDSTFEVEVRRFGEDWVRLDETGPNEALQLSLPGLGAPQPWEVRADGACRVGARAP